MHDFKFSCLLAVDLLHQSHHTNLYMELLQLLLMQLNKEVLIIFHDIHLVAKDDSMD